MKSKLLHSFPYALAAGLLFFGVQKFGAENAVFEIIAERSGFDFFEPMVRRFTGVAEIATALLFLIPRVASKKLASLLTGALLSGAIGFHLSPWLGINVPGIGPGLFFTALVLLAFNTVLLIQYFKRPSQLKQLATSS